MKIIEIPTTMIDIQEGQEWILSMINNILMEVLVSTAEYERRSLRRMQQDGIDSMKVVDGKKVSKKTNRPIGRPKTAYPQRWEEFYQDWKAKKISAVEATKVLGLKKNTFYNLVKQYESNGCVR